jgi:hypothetical protein
MLALLVVALLWAALAQIDEVARGEGKVVPVSQNQHIQSLDGGVVSKILVKEGQIVQKGQLLLNIDNTRFVSSLNENQAQYLSLLAKARGCVPSPITCRSNCPRKWCSRLPTLPGRKPTCTRPSAASWMPMCPSPGRS